MKSTLILIGYIICSLKCEMNKTEAEEKIDNVQRSNDKNQQVDVEQPKNAVQPEDVEITDAVDTTTAAAAEDTTYTINTIAEAAAIDTTYAVEQPDNTEQLEELETTDAVDATDGVDETYAVEQPVDTERPENVETTYAVDTTDAVDTTYAEEQPVYTEQPEDVENTKAIKIKVEDALKILEKSKKKYTLESVALIKKLEWLRSMFNITELMIDHKIDPNEDFDDVSNTENSLNSSNILRKRVTDGFLHVKHAILKASNFKAASLSGTKKKQMMANVKEEAKKYKTIFIATHSDRDNLKNMYLADSD